MAHAVYEINGEDSMAYTGDMPWHGLGQKVEKGAPLEVWAKQAHLDWTVSKMPVRYEGIDGNLLTFDNKMVIRRNDNGLPLGLVTDDYNPVQPAEVLEFFRASVDKLGFVIDTAGTLHDGRRVWALADIGKDLRLFGQDLVHGYLLLTTSYDSSLRTTAAFTSIRVVCNNTLSTAYSRTEQQDAKGEARVVKISHRSVFEVQEVYANLGLADKIWADFSSSAQRLAEKAISEENVVKFFVNLFHNQEKMKEDFSDVPKRTVSKLIELYKNGPGSELKSASGTVWGVVNAVTRFFDHERKSHSTSNRLDSAWYGDGAAYKAKAWDLAMKKAA